MSLSLYHKISVKSELHRSRSGTFRFPFLLLLLAVFAAFPFAPSAPAQGNAAPAPAPAAPSSNRFLFIVDTSGAMQHHALEQQQVVEQILQSRATGQLHRGDTVGLWTFDQEVHAGYFPLQVWSPDGAPEVAMRAGEFLSQQHYGKRSRLDKALAAMYEVMETSDIITVFIISDGEGQMRGSPFDREINASWQQFLKEMKKEKMPIVTVLQAKGGRILKYTTSAFPWPVIVPELPIALKVVQAPPTQPRPGLPPSSAGTNARPETLAAAPSGTNVASNRIPAPVPAEVAKPIQQPPTIKLESPPTVSLPTPALAAPPRNETAKNDAAPAQLPEQVPIPRRNPAPEPSGPPPMPAETKPEIVASAPKPSAQPTPAPTVSEAPVLPARPPVVMPARTSAPALTPQRTNSSGAQATLALPPETGGRSKGLLAASLTLLLVAAGLIFLLVRRYRAPAGPSLITRSMGNQRK